MNQTPRAPAHLWIIGILALLWNALGAFDYIATQYRLDFYMKQFSAEQLEYFYTFPAWADGTWAIAVWSSLLGTFGLLFRRAWAVWLFGAAIVCLAINTVYNFVLSDGIAVMGSAAVIFSGVIWIIALFLFFYARALTKRGVLT
jgi:hypothetical protein